MSNDTHFLPWDDVCGKANEFGFEMVPVCFRGVFNNVEEITEFFQQNIKTPSYLGSTKEGFVIRTVDQFSIDKFSTNVSKYVRKNHVQTDEHWTKNWKSIPFRKD